MKRQKNKEAQKKKKKKLTEKALRFQQLGQQPGKLKLEPTVSQSTLTQNILRD